MENLLKISTIFLFALLTFSCRNEDNSISEEQNIETQLKQLESRIGEVNELGNKNESIITYSVTFNSETNNYELKNIEVQGEHFIPLARTEAGKTKYIVTCGEGEDAVVTECGGIRCVANAVKDCLDGGGCATICEARMMYIPAKLKY